MAAFETEDRLAAVLAEMSQHEKAVKLERYHRLNALAKRGQILLCGSSLMEQFPINELLMDQACPLTVYNRGIGGFTTSEMAQALETCVFELEPRAVIINIGTNDMNGPDYELDALIGRYENILMRIRERLPSARIILLAYYPVNPEVGREDPNMAAVLEYRTNQRIREANAAVKAMAERLALTFLDLNGGITDDLGQMRAAYTIEGMHMYGDGYAQVLRELMPVLRSL